MDGRTHRHTYLYNIRSSDRGGETQVILRIPTFSVDCVASRVQFFRKHQHHTTQFTVQLWKLVSREMPCFELSMNEERRRYNYPINELSNIIIVKRLNTSSISQSTRCNAASTFNKMHPSDGEKMDEDEEQEAKSQIIVVVVWFERLSDYEKFECLRHLQNWDVFLPS